MEHKQEKIANELTNSRAPFPAGHLREGSKGKYWNWLYLFVFLFLVLQVIFYYYITNYFQ